MANSATIAAIAEVRQSVRMDDSVRAAEIAEAADIAHTCDFVELASYAARTINSYALDSPRLKSRKWVRKNTANSLGATFAAPRPPREGGKRIR